MRTKLTLLDLPHIIIYYILWLVDADINQDTANALIKILTLGDRSIMKMSVHYVDPTLCKTVRMLSHNICSLTYYRLNRIMFSNTNYIILYIGPDTIKYDFNQHNILTCVASKLIFKHVDYYSNKLIYKLKITSMSDEIVTKLKRFTMHGGYRKRFTLREKKK